MSLETIIMDISKFLTSPVPMEYLNWGLVALFLLSGVYQFFGGQRLANFYFVSFIGLLPFRLMKANTGLESEVVNMTTGSVLFAVTIFLLVWYYIDQLLPLLFNTRVG